MISKISVGPLLGLESDTLYTICFLTEKEINNAHVIILNNQVVAKKITDVYGGAFWRAEINIALDQNPKNIKYSIKLDGNKSGDVNGRDEWEFYVPGNAETPKFAFATCNGFSSADLVTKTEDPYLLWRELAKEHTKENFSLLLMGGDQLYADEIWSAVPEIKKWGELRKEEKIKKKASEKMKNQIDRFYNDLYLKRWSNPDMSLILSSIPTVMMWDDHDIFDGWGSYPDDMQACDVYQTIFETAKRYFEIFQIRSNENKSLLNPQATHFAFGFHFRGYNLLAMDNRTERSRAKIMSGQQWDDIINFLDNTVLDNDLLIISAVPVVYRDFSFTETYFDKTPWEEELTDDLKDHWRAKEHQGERARLIMRLLENVKNRQQNSNCHTVILSGDVHIGCIGVINDQREQKTRKLHQIVSSGIIHPPPSRIQWIGIMAVTNDNVEHLNEDKTIEIRMLKPYGSPQYIRSRNYITLKKGTDKKLWINWVCESDDKPAYPLE